MKKYFGILLLTAAVALGVGARSSVETPVRASLPQGTAAPKVIKIVAHRFEFVPDRITLKKGEPVVLQVTSEDVTHGFFVRPLKIDEELEPGETRQIPLTPQASGTYTIICDHFCGVNHGNMRMTIEVVE